MVIPSANVRVGLTNEFAKHRIMKSRVKFPDFTYTRTFTKEKETEDNENNKETDECMSSVEEYYSVGKSGVVRWCVCSVRSVIVELCEVGLLFGESVSYESNSGELHQLVLTLKKEKKSGVCG